MNATLQEIIKLDVLVWVSSLWRIVV